MAEDLARPVVHWEVQARDAQRLRDFYAQMFNWVIGEGPIMNIPAGVGGPQPGPGGHIRQSEKPGVSLYIQVLNLRASLEKAVQLGGSVHMQPVDSPGRATLAGIADPEGNRIMLVQQ